MKKNVKRLILVFAVLFLLSMSCITSEQTGVDTNALKATELSLKETEIALSAAQLVAERDRQATSAAGGAVQPTMGVPPVQNTPQTIVQPTVDIPLPAVEVAPANVNLIQQVSTDRKTFYCVPSSGPTKLTVTATISNIDKGLAVWWRLQVKGTEEKTEWQFKDMHRAGGNNRDFTFDADSWAGTNNFYYPPLLGESWFQYQIIADGNIERTEVFSDVTFFPCAQ